VLHDITFSVPRGQTVAIIARTASQVDAAASRCRLWSHRPAALTWIGRVTSLLDLGGSFSSRSHRPGEPRFFHQIIARNDAMPRRGEKASKTSRSRRVFRPPRAHLFIRNVSPPRLRTATCENPDILLIDEVLAVGDARFKQKCYGRLREMRDAPRRYLLVTHVVLGLAGVCDRVLVIEERATGLRRRAGAGVDRYYQLFFMAPELPVHEGSSREMRYGLGGASIVRAFVSRDGENETNAFDAGDVARVILDIALARDVEAPQFGFACSTKEGVRIYATTSGMLGETPRPARAGDRRRIEIAFRVDVTVGDLFLDLSVFEVVQGAIVMFDARIGVLHITVAPRFIASASTDLGAVIRVAWDNRGLKS